MLKIGTGIYLSKLFSVILFLNITIICYSQQANLNFNFNETPLSEVIKEISKQSKINILYNPNILPGDVRISGTYKNLDLHQALDKFLANTGVLYKYFKKDIVLFKEDEVVDEKHNTSRNEPSREYIPDRIHVIVTDTVTYSVITFDTVVSRITDTLKHYIIDTLKVYDTVKTAQQVKQPYLSSNPKFPSFSGGITISGGIFNPAIYVNHPDADSAQIIKSTLQAKSYSTFGINFKYNTESWLIEAEIGLSKLKYTFDYSWDQTETVTRVDTIDRYYTYINGFDTTWVYVTEDRLVDLTTRNRYVSDLNYNYLNVLLCVGYNKFFRRISFEFKGGILFNYYLGSSGTYLTISPENKLYVEKSKAPDSDFSIDVYAAMAIDYPVTDKIHIFAQPSFSYTGLSGGYKQKAYYFKTFQAGLKTGIRYFF